MANTLSGLSVLLTRLRDNGAGCALSGGWAEELLGLRPPGPHGDIDLVHCGDTFDPLERALSHMAADIRVVNAKRFHHKRAFIHDDVLCEVILVEDADREPFTMFWGDTRFRWASPLLHPQRIAVADAALALVSVENLRKYRREHAAMRPQRWKDATSVEPRHG